MSLPDAPPAGQQTPSEVPQRSRTLFMKTYGCQMNVYDSHRMTDALAPLGYREVHSPEEADLIILNTCHIREKAAEKVYSEIGRLNPIKKANNGIIAVAGCVAQAEGEEIIRRAPSVDLVFGPQTYHRLPELVRQAEAAAGAASASPAQRRSARIVDTAFPTEEKFDFLPEESRNQGVSAFLTVQEGCDKFCTFCVVPYTRGAELSRSGQQILDEARRMVAGGTREITLLGQNVNAYHGRGPQGQSWDLTELIAALSEIDGLARIRFTTSHPRDMDDRLIAAFRDLPKLMPYLHLPVQAGSDRILRAMNRKHDRERYFDIIDRLRAVRPDLALSGDFIVGFPGETDSDFADTLSLVTRVNYAQAYSFKYSPRPGTPAADIDAAVPAAVADDRLQSLQSLLNAQQEAFNRGCEGRTLDVLLERHGKRPGQLIGRSPYMQSVHLVAPDRLLGQILPVKIIEGQPNSLKGEVVILDPDRPAAGEAAWETAA